VYLQAFNSDQLQALALLLLRINDRGAAMALVFFGFNGLVSGYLIFKSGFLPRIFGVVSVIASVGWLTFLYPPLGYRMFNYTALVGLLGSLALIAWLLIVGVNEQRWEELASRSETERL
jgi:hypothetical protein